MSPSALLQIEDPEFALEFDMAMCATFQERETERILNAARESAGGGFFQAVMQALLERR